MSIFLERKTFNLLPLKFSWGDARRTISHDERPNQISENPKIDRSISFFCGLKVLTMSVSRGSIAYLTGLPIKVASENSVVLQVSAYDKRITKGIYRYRCEINDGQQRVWAMFGTQCTEDFDNQTIIPGSIIRINNAMNTEGKNAVRCVNINFSHNCLWIATTIS